MLTALLVIVGAYFAFCYAWGIYLIIRLATGRRVRRLLPLRSSAGQAVGHAQPEAAAAYQPSAEAAPAAIAEDYAAPHHASRDNRQRAAA